MSHPLQGWISGVRSHHFLLRISDHCLAFNDNTDFRVDSAQWYYNERDVGQAIREFLASHANTGITRGDVWFTTKLKANSTYEAARADITKSLRESGLDYIDLFLLHSPYGGKQARLEAWRAVEDAIEAGEVKVGGVSNFGARHVSNLYRTTYHHG
jgi:diketogulonate reductase-like aldo/keto reductase